MRVARNVLVFLALGLSLLAADQPQAPLAALCANGIPGAPACFASKKDLNEAKAAFAHGRKLQNSKRLVDAFAQFERAAQLVPHDIQYVTAREMARQQLVYEHLQRGNSDLATGREIEALAEFRNAVELDPHNEFAEQQLKDIVGSWAPRTSQAPRVIEDAGPIELTPQSRRVDFHYRGDARALLTQIAASFGISAIFDDSVASRRVRFDMQDVDFATAMQAASKVTKTSWTPLSSTQILLFADTTENHRLFDRMALRTFYIPAASTPQELTDLVNALRTLFEVKFVSQNPKNSTLVVRAPRQILDPATQFLEGLDSSRPEVVLDVNAYEINRTFTRNLGLHIPNQFNLFNIGAAALQLAGGQNIQDLINQLIASGGINQANSTALSALLAQLQNQQNSIFKNPLATFGGGKTLFGLSLDQITATLSVNESFAKTLEHAILRAAQDKDVTFHVGTRFPILNAIFAPIFNSAAIGQSIQNNSFQAAFPSVSYEDLGLSIKAKPSIHGNSDVSLQLELQLRTLAGQTVNGVPIISNREYKGSITLRDSEPAVVAGAISRTDLYSMSGVPGLGMVPGLNKIMTTNTKELDDDELLIVIIPHVISSPERNSSEIWMTTKGL